MGRSLSTTRITGVMLAAALVGGLVPLTMPPPLAAAAPPSLTLDSTSTVVIATGPVATFEVVNSSPDPVSVDAVRSIDVTEDYQAGGEVDTAIGGGADSLYRAVDDVQFLDATTSFPAAASCTGATLGPGDRCRITVRLDAALRPAGVGAGTRVEVLDPIGNAIGSVFVQWLASSVQPAGDQLLDAGITSTDWTTVQPVIVGDNFDTTAEAGEPGHAGTAAAHSWWRRLDDLPSGRLSIDLQALDDSYGTGVPTANPIRAALYRIPAGDVPSMGALVPVVATAAAASTLGALRLTTPVEAGNTYYLAIDDLGVGTHFVANAAWSFGGVGFDPSDADSLERRTLTVAASGSSSALFTVYNRTATSPADATLDATMPALTGFEWTGVSDPAGSCDATDAGGFAVSFPTQAAWTLTAPSGTACVVAVRLAGGTPLAPRQSRTEAVTVVDSNGLGLSVEYTVKATTRAPGPANDDFADARDISTIAIPPFDAIPGPFPNTVTPRTTAVVDGDTNGATREPFEYGTVVTANDPRTPDDDTETPPPTGTVWYRFTAPPSGFSGRLGIRVTPGFELTPLIKVRGIATPSPRFDVTQFAPGNTWPPSSLQFVRMEPGHTVWFQVSARYDQFNGTREPDGPFTIELYQAPNEQDDIANAYDVSFDRPWSVPFNWGGDGDTFHLTADQPGAPADGWFTATFDQPGFWSFAATSNTAAAVPSGRPLGLRLYRSPSTARVSDAAVLGAPIATAGGSLQVQPTRDENGVFDTAWVTQFRNIPVQPGRYYWSFDVGAGGPTFFNLLSSFDALPKATATVTDCAGGPVPSSGNESAFGGVFFPLTVPPTTPGTLFSGVATGFDLSAKLVASATDQAGDADGTTCSPSATLEGELRLDSELGDTEPVPVPVNILATARAVDALGDVLGTTQLSADASVIAEVTLTDPDTGLPVFEYVRRLDRSTSADPLGAATSRGTASLRVDGAPVASVPDTDVAGTVSCAGATCTVTPATTELGAEPATVQVPLRPGVRYRYSISLEATVTVRSADQAGAALTGALLDAGNSLRVAFTAPAGTSLRCSSTARYCPARLPGDAPDVTPPDTAITAPAATNTTGLAVRFAATEGNVTYECRVGAEPFGPCRNPLVLANVAEGPITIEAIATDAAGNADPSPASATVVVDRTPPDAAIQQPVNGAAFDSASVPASAIASCTDTGAGVSSVELRVDGALTEVLATSVGTHTVAIECTDAAGNRASLTHTYTVTKADTTPPTVTIAGIGAGATVTTATTSVTISSDEPLVNVICTLDITRDDNGSSSSNDIGCLPTPPTLGGIFTFPELPDGLVTLTIQGFDAAGNIGTATLSFNVQVDPVVTITSPGQGATYPAGAVPALAYTCSDNNGTVVDETISLGTNGDTWPGSPPDTAGNWRINVDCLDAVGNGGTASVTYTVVSVDTTPPDTTIDSLTVTGRNVAATVTATDDRPGTLTLECAVEAQIGYRDGLETWQTCTSPATYSGLAEGYYLLLARATDAAGNTDPTPAIRSFTVDVSPPQLAIYSPPDGATYLPGQVPELFWACTDLDINTSLLTVTVNGTPLVGVDLPDTPGTYVVAVRCVDRVGLSTTVTHTYTVIAPDTTPPTVTIAGIGAGATVTTATTSVTISSDEPLVNVICTLDITRDDNGSSSSNDIGCLPTPPTLGGIFTFPELPDGLVTLTIQGFDAAGNIGTATLSFAVAMPPTVSITAPADGSSLFADQVPSDIAFTCTDNDGPATFLEAQFFGPSGWELLSGPLPSTPGTYRIAVLCLDAVANEGRTEATYTVLERPRLSVDIVRSPLGDPVPSTTPMSFTIRVRNEGTQPNPSRTVRIVLPPELIVTAATVDPLTGPGVGTRFCVFDPGVPLAVGDGIAGQAITCTLSDPLAAGTTEDLVVLPELRGPAGTPVTVSASVSAAGCVDAVGGEVCGTVQSLFSIGLPPDTTPPDTQLDRAGTVVGFVDTSPATQPTFTFTGSDDRPGPVTFECRVTTVIPTVTLSGIPPLTYPPDPQPGWTPCTSPFTRTGLAESSYEFSVRSVDAAGNRDLTPPAIAFAVDTTPPEIFFNAQGPGGVSPMPFASGDRVTADQVPPQIVRTCRDTYLSAYRYESSTRGVEAENTLGVAASLVTGGADLPTTLGRHWFSIACTNVSGLTTTQTFFYTVVTELIPPTITISGIADGATVTTATPSVTVSSDEPLFATICNLETPTPEGGTDSNDIGCVADGSSSDTFELPTLPDGTVTLRVFGQDAAGNRSEVSVTFSVEVLPTASITSPADGATYTPSQVPTSVSYLCSDNSFITSEEVQLVPQGGGQPVLLSGPPPAAIGTHTIRVVCVDALGEEAVATATYTVRNPTILDVRTVDTDGQPVVGACYSIDVLSLFTYIELERSCDSATGANADGAADGVVRFVEPTIGTLAFLRNRSLPPVRYPIRDRLLGSVPQEQTTTITISTYRCDSTCLLVRPKLGDGTEPTVPVRPLGVAFDLPEPAPATPPFPTAFVIPNLTPGVATDIPVVADDFGRTPLEVGRIRVNPTAGLNTLDPLTILPAHTITVTLQRPDGSALNDGGTCLQLRGVSPVRAGRVLCTDAGSDTLRWRALPGFYVVETPPGTVLPSGVLAPVLPANVPDTQSEQQLDVVFRTSQGGRVTVSPLNFQLAPIAQLPAVAAPACEIGLFLVVDGTQAASPTATACFGSGTNPAPAVMTVSPGTYVVTRTSSWNVPGLTTGANLVTVGAGDAVATDLTLFDPNTGDVPTAQPDTATTRPGRTVSGNVLTNDSDPSDQPLRATLVGGPSKGVVTLSSDGAFNYTPDDGTAGTDVITYAAIDPWGNRAETTLTVTIVPLAALTVTVAVDPAAPISRGLGFDQVVTVRNTSGQPATAATVTIPMPAGVVYAGGVTPTSCSAPTPGTNGNLVCGLGTIAAGGVATVRIPLRMVTRPTSQQLAFAAAASSSDCADTDPSSPGNQCADVTLLVDAPRTPIRVAVSADTSPVAPGRPFRYFIDTTNDGPVRAEVTVVIDLPSEAGLVSLSSLPALSGCTFSPPLSAGANGTSDVTTTCRFPVPAGTTARIAMDAVALRAPAGGVLAAVASAESQDCISAAAPGASGSCGPPASGGPTVTVTTLAATFQMVTPAAGTEARVGDLVRFRVGVDNGGTIPARSPQVQIQLPPELALSRVVSLPPLASCTFSPPLVPSQTPAVRIGCNLATLAAGASAVFEIEARVLEVPAAPAAAVTVRVSSIDCADASPAAGVQCDTIAAGPRVARVALSPVITMTPATAAVGDTVQLTMTTRNDGAIPARSLRTRIALPAELALLGITQLPVLSGCTFSPPLQPGVTPSVTVNCTHPDLAPGASITTVVSARVLALPASGNFDVRAEAGSTDCRDLIAGDGRRTCATAILRSPITSLDTSFGGLTLRTDNGVIDALQSISSTLLPVSPNGVAFPYGAMSFTVTDVGVGGTAEIFIGATDPSANYWKLQPNGWSQYPTTRQVPGGLVITLVDGGAGDADGIANGIIVDPGAVGIANRPPTSRDLTVSTEVGQPVTVEAADAATDPDGGSLEVVSAGDGSIGTVEVNPTSVVYTPAAGVTGSDSFAMTVSDGQGGTVEVTVRVTVTPAGVADSYSVRAGEVLQVSQPGVLGNDRGPNLTAALVDGPVAGTLALAANGSFTYTAPATKGQRTFTYRPVSNGITGPVTTVTIDVLDPPSPTGVADSYSVAAGGTLTIVAPGVLVNDTGIGGITAQPATPPAAGTLTLDPNGSFTYVAPTTPGPQTFTYRPVGPGGPGAETQVTITVHPSTARPTLSVADTSVVEGNRGVRRMPFVVTLTDPPATGEVSVRYFTRGVTASPWRDYVPTNGTLRFRPGQTQMTVFVVVLGDTRRENNETLQLVLNNPSGATIGRSPALGTIVNDDRSGRR